MSTTDWGSIDTVLLDVDGVLTDGVLLYAAEAEDRKRFHARDGAMIRRATAAGLRIGLCSGRATPAVRIRARELDLAPCLLGVDDKLAAVTGWLREQGLDWSQLAMVGDDLPDLGLFARVGLAVAVADAAPLLRRRAHWVSSLPGGRGAVAEVLERLLRRQGRWPTALASLAGGHG